MPGGGLGGGRAAKKSPKNGGKTELSMSKMGNKEPKKC